MCELCVVYEPFCPFNGKTWVFVGRYLGLYYIYNEYLNMRARYRCRRRERKSNKPKPFPFGLTNDRRRSK